MAAVAESTAGQGRRRASSSETECSQATHERTAHSAGKRAKLPTRNLCRLVDGARGLPLPARGRTAYASRSPPGPVTHLALASRVLHAAFLDAWGCATLSQPTPGLRPGRSTPQAARRRQCLPLRTVAARRARRHVLRHALQGHMDERPPRRRLPQGERRSPPAWRAAEPLRALTCLHRTVGRHE